MRMKKRLLVIPAAVLLAGASGIGFVHASTGTASQPAISTSPQTDNATGNVQQGDQNTPDVAGAADTPAEANAPETAAAAESTSPDGDNVQQGDQSGPDTGN